MSEKPSSQLEALTTKVKDEKEVTEEKISAAIGDAAKQVDAITDPDARATASAAVSQAVENLFKAVKDAENRKAQATAESNAKVKDEITMNLEKSVEDAARKALIERVQKEQAASLGKVNALLEMKFTTEDKEKTGDAEFIEDIYDAKIALENIGNELKTPPSGEELKEWAVTRIGNIKKIESRVSDSIRRQSLRYSIAEDKAKYISEIQNLFDPNSAEAFPSITSKIFEKLTTFNGLIPAKGANVQALISFSKNLSKEKDDILKFASDQKAEITKEKADIEAQKKSYDSAKKQISDAEEYIEKALGSTMFTIIDENKSDYIQNAGKEALNELKKINLPNPTPDTNNTAAYQASITMVKQIKDRFITAKNTQELNDLGPEGKSIVAVYDEFIDKKFKTYSEFEKEFDKAMDAIKYDKRGDQKEEKRKKDMRKLAEDLKAKVKKEFEDSQLLAGLYRVPSQNQSIIGEAEDNTDIANSNSNSSIGQPIEVAADQDINLVIGEGKLEVTPTPEQLKSEIAEYKKQILTYGPKARLARVQIDNLVRQYKDREDEKPVISYEEMNKKIQEHLAEYQVALNRWLKNNGIKESEIKDENLKELVKTARANVRNKRAPQNRAVAEKASSTKKNVKVPELLETLQQNNKTITTSDLDKLWKAEGLNPMGASAMGTIASSINKKSPDKRADELKAIIEKAKKA